MLDCRQTLEHTGGDIEQAVDHLRRQAAAEAAKRAERVTGQGRIDSYIHHDARVGALVEVNCETDFVARTEYFRALVHHVAEQVAATPPEVEVAEETLMAQEWIRDSSRTVADLVNETAARTGERVRVRRVVRFRLGDA
jgi:elongation factor Ts